MSTPKQKNIILCSDGTGNTAVKGRGTNVFKLFEAIDLTEYRTKPELDAQLAFYDDGVGTQGIAPLKILGGAAGYGLAHNVKKLYRELARVYDPGDRIFLFGFSRGAFTVRTLAGMIGACGVLKGGEFTTSRALRKAVDDAYAMYRSSYRSKLTDWWASRTQQKKLEIPETKVHADVPIRFLGVWDTVDAVGMPFALAEIVNKWVVQFKFPARTLGKHVEHAYHALSLDDDRRAFQPVLWHAAGDERVEQVWFAGVHSNVGGGYPKQGMSLVALDWMLRKAADHGLRMQRLDIELFRGHASVDDMIYDPRAGTGIFYRWAPRDVADYCAKSGIPPCIHMSVMERAAHGTSDYAPGNIPPNAQLAYTAVDADDPDRDAKEALLRKRAAALQKTMNDALHGRYLIHDVSRELAIGDASYWAFMIAWLCFAIAAITAGTALLAGDFEWRWSIVLPIAMGVVGFLAAWRVSLFVDDKMDDTFSEFWQKHQSDLRSALKQVAADARRQSDNGGPARGKTVAPNSLPVEPSPPTDGLT